jgi:hypothetical protein
MDLQASNVAAWSGQIGSRFRIKINVRFTSTALAQPQRSLTPGPPARAHPSWSADGLPSCPSFGPFRQRA